MRDYRGLLDEAARDTAPDADVLARVAADVERRKGARPNGRAPWILAGAAALVAAGVLAWVATPTQVSRSLDHVGDVALGAQVEVISTGEGVVSGTARDMKVAWVAGTLGVEVEPNQGVKLSIETEEGVVSVVGTGFDVGRDALGTTVTVRHGKVRVDCVRGGETFLTVGETRTCEPIRASGALARVLALQGVVSEPALLAEIDGALTRPDATGAVAAELLAMRAGSLLTVGREADALAAAEIALAHPSVTREVELHRMAARLGLGVGVDATRCAQALPHLHALAAAGDLGADAPALAACEAVSPSGIAPR